MEDVKIYALTFEDEAMKQVKALAGSAIGQGSKIRIMPDAHSGKGCVIGTSMTITDKVCPSLVGVDIGCGMLTLRLNKSDIDFCKLDRVIREYVPYGVDVHEKAVAKFERLNDLRCLGELRDTKRFEQSIGTLGGGNHFIEIDKNDFGNLYLIIHSGSRNLGNQVAKYYQDKAVELRMEYLKSRNDIGDIIKRYKLEGREDEIQGEIERIQACNKAIALDIPNDLCYLTGKWKEDYLHDMSICQEYASLNRKVISELIISNYGDDLGSLWDFETIHNYIDFEDNILRKGAISAKKGEPVLIPINMRDGCIFGTGKGNEDWNCSAPHGAGRLYSRKKAKELLSMESYKTAMKGIFTTCVNENTLDEAPFAYKSMDEILSLIEPTVSFDFILVPVYNFKAN